MYWKIDKDCLPGEGYPSNAGTWGEAGYGCAVARNGKIGTSTYKGQTICPVEDSELTVRFRILDDDGEPYYEGRMTHALALSDGVLAPLDDFAMPQAGATSLEISFGGLDWEQV